VNVNDELFFNASSHNVLCVSSVANVNYVLNRSLHAGDDITLVLLELVVHRVYNVDTNDVHTDD